ncbi:peptidylprolyl isomerase [Petrocella sp. FN5]|uniref:peptidylprolyl isomerase n=1 Tax=Petrocella sp. FN5 TaxID=3032002 RepID=UPI0023DAA084|nr:peptidylprolyl isomerase [Petrocella sp. FN5]MDF1617129.1 peptidylprolyl isomerase [Petrocella sp. FN5]
MKKIMSLIVASILVLSLMTACTSGDSVMTVNGESVPVGEAIFVLRELEAMYESQYGPTIWEQGFEGKTFDEIAKEAAIDSLSRLHISALIAKERGIELTDEELAIIDTRMDEYLLTKSEEVLKEDDISLENVKTIFVNNALGEKLMDLELEDFIVNEEELTLSLQGDVSYQQILQYGYDGVLEQVQAQHILIANKNEDGTEKEGALELAREVLAKVNAGEDFTELVKTYSEDPGKVENDGIYTFYQGEMVPEFDAAAFSMENGEISDLVVSDFGYHIIKKMDHIYPSEEEVMSVKEYEGYIKDQYARSQKQGEFDQLFNAWKEDYTVEVNQKVWDKVVTTNKK